MTGLDAQGPCGFVQGAEGIGRREVLRDQRGVERDPVEGAQAAEQPQDIVAPYLSLKVHTDHRCCWLCISLCNTLPSRTSARNVVNVMLVKILEISDGAPESKFARTWPALRRNWHSAR